MEYYQWEDFHNHPLNLNIGKESMKQEADGPILIDIDKASWQQHVNRVSEWLGHTLMVQVTFYQLTLDTINKIQEPHIKSAIIEISQTALYHIQKAQELFSLIGRNPHYYTYYEGKAVAEFKETITKLKGMLGGVKGDWLMMHQLYLSNMNALDAFSVTEQFGLTLGLPKVSTTAMMVAHQKQAHGMVLKEYMLEMASLSIIYDKNI